MEKIKKNLHIIIIILLLIISITSIFLNIKFNKKTIKINAEEIPSNYISYNATLNEDLSGKNIRFNINFIKNLTTNEINNFDRTKELYIYGAANSPIMINNNNEVSIVSCSINKTYDNNRNMYSINVQIVSYTTTSEIIYYAKKYENEEYNEITINQEKINLIYQTQQIFNNTTTASQNQLEMWNTYGNKLILMEEEILINTPTLTRELNTLIWTSSNNANYEIWKNNQLLTTTNINRYIAISNGTYKIRTIIENNYSDFSNEIIINNIEEQGQYTFLTLFGNLADSQLYLIQSMLNFEILGFNLYQLFTALLTLCIIIIICKIALFK